MSCQRQEVQPFQPALSLTILLFYQHTKSIQKATDQIIVSDQIQWITLGAWSPTLLKFPLKCNTEASTTGCSSLLSRARGWSTSDWVSRTVNRSSRTKNHYASWSDLRRWDSLCPSALNNVKFRSSCQGSVQYRIFNNENITTSLKNSFNVWPSLWWRIFFPGIYLGFIMVCYSRLLPLIFITMHLGKNLAPLIFSAPSH